MSAEFKILLTLLFCLPIFFLLQTPLIKAAGPNEPLLKCYQEILNNHFVKDAFALEPGARALLLPPPTIGLGTGYLLVTPEACYLFPESVLVSGDKTRLDFRLSAREILSFRHQKDHIIQYSGPDQGSKRYQLSFLHHYKTESTDPKYSLPIFEGQIFPPQRCDALLTKDLVSRVAGVSDYFKKLQTYTKDRNAYKKRDLENYRISELRRKFASVLRESDLSSIAGNNAMDFSKNPRAFLKKHPEFERSMGIYLDQYGKIKDELLGDSPPIHSFFQLKECLKAENSLVSEAAKKSNSALPESNSKLSPQPLNENATEPATGTAGNAEESGH